MSKRKYKGVDSRQSKVIHTKNNYICFYCFAECIPCGDDTLEWNCATIDHVIPHSRVQESKLPNLVTCCNKCNGKKQNMSLYEYCIHMGYSYTDMRIRFSIYCIYHIWLIDRDSKLFSVMERKLHGK